MSVQAGDVVHVVEPITLTFRPGLFGDSEVLSRGRTVVLTDAIIAANADGVAGRSIFDLVHAPEEQERRWGAVRIGFGPWPENAPTWRHGDSQWAEERANALADAWHIQDERRRDAALRDVRSRFGSAPTSRTTMTYSTRR